MTPTRRPKTDDQRQDQHLRQSAAAVERHARERRRALAEVAKWPFGVAPMVGLAEALLMALAKRGLVERRYILTREGRRAVEASGVTPDSALDVVHVDGRPHRVPREVAAHIKFIADLNAKMADRAVHYAQEAIALREEVASLQQGRAA